VGGINGCGNNSFRGGRINRNIGGACGSTWIVGGKGYMKGFMIGGI